MVRQKSYDVPGVIAGVILLFIIGYTGCKKDIYNPFDPNSNDYQKPRITYLSLVDSSEFLNDTLPVAWQANHPEYCLYSYKFQENEPWSGWGSATSLKEILSDGNYAFQVSVRYHKGVDTTIASASFIVNALSSSAVYLYPRKQIVTDSNPSVSFTVCCKALSPCTAMEILVSGSPLGSVSFTDTTMTNSFVLFHDNLIDVGISPFDRPIAGTRSFLTITVTPPATADTSIIEITVPKAEMINDSVQISVIVNEVKGAFIIRQ